MSSDSTILDTYVSRGAHRDVQEDITAFFISGGGNGDLGRYADVSRKL